MRVFNTLMLHGQLEPKQISEFIMREHKEARELLYRMFKAGYLQMQVCLLLLLLLVGLCVCGGGGVVAGLDVAAAPVSVATLPAPTYNIMLHDHSHS